MDILLNADDFGKSPEVNQAICQCFEKGIIQRTTIMVTAEYFEDAVLLSKECGFFDKVGLHINLDDGEPLTEEMRKNNCFCNNGKYRERVFMNPKYRYLLNRSDKNCLKKEIEAQMNKYLNVGFPLRHFDSHHFVHNNLSVISIVCGIGYRLGFKSARVMEIRKDEGFLRIGYKKLLNAYIRRFFKTSGQFLQNLNNFNNQLGSVEFMVHPTLSDNNLLNIVSWNPDAYDKFDKYAANISYIKSV